MFWCAGCQGSMYPMNGNVSASIGHVQASRLVLSRFAYKLHRELVSLGTMGSKGLCGKYLMPVMSKQQYRFQANNPNPETSGRYDRKSDLEGQSVSVSVDLGGRRVI